MVGTDIIEISRIEKSIEKESFVKRAFTPDEWEYISSKAKPAQSAAGIFCAKEAISKALGTGISRGVKLSDIEITHEASGKPSAVLRGPAKDLFEKAGYKTIAISISHSRDYAVAFCVFTNE